MSPIYRKHFPIKVSYSRENIEEDGHLCKEDAEVVMTRLCGENIEQDGHPCKEDVEVVMTRLWIFPHHPESEIRQERLGSGDILSLFEEKEPGLDDVKEAFDVFDENRDGFLDAREIHRVLYNLGFKDGMEIEKCKKTIDVFDDNGDGRIDFKEFVKLMENMFFAKT